MLDLKPQNLHALCHKLWSYFRYYLHQNSASLTFVDFLPLAEEIKNKIYKLFVVFVVFSVMT